MQQKIKEETCQVEIIDRHQQIEIAEHEIRRKQCELDSKIKKPAEAEKFRLEKLAGELAKMTSADFKSFSCWSVGIRLGHFCEYCSFEIHLPFFRKRNNIGQRSVLSKNAYSQTC